MLIAGSDSCSDDTVEEVTVQFVSHVDPETITTTDSNATAGSSVSIPAINRCKSNMKKNILLLL